MDNNISDFMKLAYKLGRVKDVEDAFKEYPVETEWHKGNEELFVREDSENYNLYSVGDIVFVKNFMYDNNKQGHNHLFVIIDHNNLVVPVEYFGMLISSQLDKLKYDTNKPLEKDMNNGLDKDSLVKTDVIYKINTNQILFKIGSVGKEVIETYKKAFLENI